MKTATLVRQPSTDDGTPGKLDTSTGFSCFTMELPWLNNAKSASCIPVGRYVCQWLYSPSHGRKIYHVTGVPGRDAVEIHNGNWAGRVDLGLRSDVLGCILLGDSLGHGVPKPKDGVTYTREQAGVFNSVATLARFEAEMDGEDFELEIR